MSTTQAAPPAGSAIGRATGVELTRPVRRGERLSELFELFGFDNRAVGFIAL